MAQTASYQDIRSMAATARRNDRICGHSVRFWCIAMKQAIKSLLLKHPILASLVPGWGFPDNARRVIQGEVFTKVLNGSDFSGRCLNAGSGEGLFNSFLDSRPGIQQVTDIDIKEPNAAPNHLRTVGSLTNMPLPDSHFDSCLCTEVIEHIEDDAQAVAELARVLKPNGLLLLSVPTPPAPYDDEHVREGYTLAQITQLLESSGFEVINSSYCFYFFMRVLIETWHWQYTVIGKKQRNFYPRIAIELLMHLDRHIPIGPPWDLVVLARKSPHERASGR